jgi:sporulation protein YlmC with PRC-barrel domain
MAQFGMLRDYRFTKDVEDIRGSELYGLNDEKLGKIDDVIFDHATADIRYIVVDTGGWLSTKKFVVPVDRLRASSKHKDAFSVDLNKQQVESFPPYKESDLESDEQWVDYENRYRAQWKADPVMHRDGTDRNITPTTYQQVGNISSERASGNLTATGKTLEVSGSAETSDIEDTGTLEGFAASTDTVEIDNSAVGIGGRWDTFQDRLRERRKEVIAIPGEYRKAS